jgi:uncharacterized protein
MKKIALLSDNHSYDGDDIYKNIGDVDEVWHAGDIGDLNSIKKLQSLGEFKAVYGNIDDKDTRALYPEDLIWTYEGLKVYMTHIGGYPGKYNVRAKQVILSERPNIFICGHSHICKILPDKTLNLLHLNPGAYGLYGFHVMRTFLLFDIHEGKVSNMRVVELGPKSLKI